MRLSDRDRDTLRWLDPKQWQRPMDIGATDGSHHSKTLGKLARLGLVERREWGGHTRPAYRYRRTPAGTRVVKEQP